MLDWRGWVAGLLAEIEALQDTLEIQSGMVVDTRGGIARELRDVQDQLSRLTALTGQIQRYGGSPVTAAGGGPGEGRP